MNDHLNPFALIKASDYTDAQINSLWVELGSAAINAVIEPRSRDSKYILGGKGTGKTHLLRYHSYPVIRLRSNSEGISIISKMKFLAIFVRAAGFDASRFEPPRDSQAKWQQLFGVYLELRLVEGVIDALRDIKKTSPNETFNDRLLIDHLSRSINDPKVSDCQSLEELQIWVETERRSIDDAVNNAAFTGALDVYVAFSIGALCIPLGRALANWHPVFLDVPVIYLVDEIENFSISQQEVLNTLVRYGEGLSTFRMTGRLYSRKTYSTIANGEENREGSEFRTSNLDEILRAYRKYPDFARRFVSKRLGTAGLVGRTTMSTSHEFDPKLCFEELDSADYFGNAIAKLGIDEPRPQFVKNFVEALRLGVGPQKLANEKIDEVLNQLTGGFPLLIQKLNLLLFCKKFSKRSSWIAIADRIASDAHRFCTKNGVSTVSYATAYGHYASDLFAQLCKESRKQEKPFYAGFESFVQMSSGNPRNLLVVLGRAYEIAAFKEIDFINGPKLSIAMQTQAAIEAARFIYERDTNYGSQSELAREGVSRLASLLRTARYALNIPEVSPLAVSFSDADLSSEAKKILDSALNYSFVFEILGGRPDRNSQKIHRKIQLNPLLSPRWGLGIARRGDISLSRELVNSMFEPSQGNVFEILLKNLHSKWNMPFGGGRMETPQIDMFHS